MINFIANSVLWTLAIYGLFEIIKTIVSFCTYSHENSDGIYLVVAAKNQEENIEAFLRSLIFKILYGKENQIKEIIAVDLDSEDDTPKILKKIAKDYDFIKVTDVKEFLDMTEVLESRKS